MKLVNISETEYNKFIKNYKNSLFFQSIEWAKFKEKTGWNWEIVGLKDSKKIVAASILLSKKVPFMNKKMYYSPRGYIIDYSNLELIDTFTKELKIYLLNKDALFLKINPYIMYQQRDTNGDIIGDNKQKLVDHLKSIGYKHYGFYKKFEEKKELEPRWLSVLELENKSIEDLLKEMRPTTRWLINKSSKNSIKVREGSYEELGIYKKIMQHTSERKEFQDRSLEYYQEMYNALKKNNIFKLLFAEINLKELSNTINIDIYHLDERINNVKDNPKKKNQVIEFTNQKNVLEKRLDEIKKDINNYGEKPIVATGIYLSYGDQVVYLFGGSYKDFMGYGAQYLMQYEMIKYAKENGYKKLNFYGIDGDFSKTSKNYGLFDFKRGFNSDVVELIGEFDLIINKKAYILYTKMFSAYKILKRIKLAVRKKIK